MIHKLERFLCKTFPLQNSAIAISLPETSFMGIPENSNCVTGRSPKWYDLRTNYQNMTLRTFDKKLESEI